MTPSPSRPSRLYALLGSPVEHSLSPAMHRAAFREMGIDARYVARETSADELTAAMRRIAGRGGGNVTVPHKERAAAALDRGTEAVHATGACNCFWQDGDGALIGDNTDVDGFVAALGDPPTASASARRARSAGPSAGDVLLLGAGGAARAVLHACLREGVSRIDVLNRTRERAEQMVAEVAGRDADLVRVLAGRGGLAAAYALVVNATSLGLDVDDPLPLSLGALDVGAAFDLVYGPDGTPWTRHARALGIPARDGLEMLVRQGAASLRRWTGRRPPLDVMREAVRRELGREAGAGTGAGGPSGEADGAGPS